MEIHLADVLTIAGAAIAAGIVTGFVEMAKAALPFIGARGWEQALALLVSLILVVLASIDAGVATLDAAFVSFVAWLTIAKLATGIHDEVTAAPGSLRAAA